MWVRKYTSRPISEEKVQTVSATLEPTVGHSLEDLMAALRNSGASVSVVGNVVAFNGDVEILRLVESIADIHLNVSQRLSQKYL